MANELKTIENPLLSKTALDKLLLLLKEKFDSIDTAGAEDIKKINQRLDTLIGKKEDGTVVDVTTAIDTFNEIKEFLSGIEDTDLQSIITAINTAISTEQTRAEGAETALGNRIKTLEDIEVMTASDVESAWDAVFNPTEP